MKTKVAKTKLVPPDGGWGWVVLFSALLVNFLIPGTVKSFGVLFVEFLQVFKASPTAASWMPALCYFLYSSLGPLSSVLSIKYSYKTVTLIGGTFAAVGMMTSYFATSVSYLYVSYGLMVGIGAGLTFPPTIYIVTAYFERLRGLANGLCISGSAIGTIVLPPFLQYLLNHFGHRGAVLIMGALTLNTLVCALLYHPVSEHMKEVPVEGIDNAAMTLDEPIIESKITEGKSRPGTPNNSNHDRLTELSKYLEKNLNPPSMTVVNENEGENELDQSEFQEPKHVPGTKFQEPNHVLGTKFQKPNYVPGTEFQEPNILPGTKFQENNVPRTEFQKPNYVPGTEFQEPSHVPGTKFQEPNYVPGTEFEEHTQVLRTEFQEQNHVPGTKFQEPDHEKNEIVLPIDTVALSRTNSTRVSKKNFHLSRHGSIVSEMGPVALSPRNNVPGLFRRFFKTPKKTRGKNKNKLEQDETSQGTGTITSTDSSATIASSESSATISSSDSSSTEDNKFFDFSVLRDPLYIVILISNSTSAISNTNFMILLPSYAISEGFDKNMSALLLSIVSALDLVGRIGGASLSDIDFVPKYYYFVGGLGLSGIALALLPMATSYMMLSFFCALFGLSSGMYIGITTVILADMLGTEKLSSSYGISLFVNGVLQLVGPPVCGAIYERVGTYKPIFLAFGIILILGTALWAVVPLIKRKPKEQQEE
ncbi:Similar to SLC16A13: Monocarboxylate transporter 13 (Homo sapiens) [Cotesia congregata]|uniref:Similar to SLC16A13: Monocarboxylate transporter 13 (Homo sapiens) n=1 Tax=Cotesia congregata TaxID=51543 RepID=A0A8J2H531_COTCN|nr:Similar to SLC16A13: Monocarboxylate transporter 13 (Homo sapiens) [Cotesia congregata]